MRSGQVMANKAPLVKVQACEMFVLKSFASLIPCFAVAMVHSKSLHACHG